MVFTQRDSAGIEIAENSAGAVPMLGAVVDEGRGGEVDVSDLSAVTAARLLSGGGLVFTDNARRRLVFWEPRGESTRTVGRAGEGPNEFQAFRGLWRCTHDSLIVRSGDAGVKVLDAQGYFVRTIPAPRVRGGAYGVSTDCRWIAFPVPWFVTNNGFSPDSTSVAWYDLRADTLSAAVTLRAQERQTISFLGERHAVTVPFSAPTLFAVHDNKLYAGTGDVPEIRIFNRDGRLVRIVRWSAERLPLTGSDRERYEATRVQLDERVGRGATERTPSLREFRLPSAKPLYSEVRVDDHGGLWVRKYPANHEGFERAYGSAFIDAEPEWWLFEASGRLLGVAVTPMNFQIKDMRNGVVAGVRSDSTDVPRIYVMPMRLDALGRGH